MWLYGVCAAFAGELLDNGDFDAGDQGWTTSIGATTGGGSKTSTVTYDGKGRGGSAALKLAGDASTRRWQSVQSTPVPVEPGSTVTLTGWMRSDQVRREGNQFENCYLGVAFLDTRGERVRVGGNPVVAASISGTRDWTELTRQVVVPSSASQVQVMVFLSMSGTTWVDDVQLKTGASTSWPVFDDGRFVYHWHDSAPVSFEQRAKNAANLARNEATLGLTIEEPIHFWRYPDKETKAKLTGNGGNAHAGPGLQLHTIWPVDSHEMIHLLTQQLGDPGTALLGEGIAVHLSGGWHGEPTDTWVRRHRDAGKLPSLAEMVDITEFRALDDMVTYPVSGSFVGWLVDSEGIDELKQAYAGAGTPEERLQRTYGRSLAELEAAWLAAVGP